MKLVSFMRVKLFNLFLAKKLSRHRLELFINQFYEESLSPHSPVAQKVADEVVFRRFQGEGVEFFF